MRSGWMCLALPRKLQVRFDAGWEYDRGVEADERSRRASLIVGWTDPSDGHGQPGLGEAGMWAQKTPGELSIEKLDILAT